MSTPSWRTGEFYRDIIEGELSMQGAGPAISVKGLHIGDATKETTGYMSFIHRVTIAVDVGPNRKHKSLSFIVKEKSEHTFGGKLVEILSVFPREREMYEHLLPAFERLWSTEVVRFGPRMFKASDGPDTVIVMEDLNRRQFRMSERRYGLPIGDVKAILSKLAKFHAASVLYREAGGTFSAHFEYGVIAEQTIDVVGSYFEVFYSSFVQSLRERNFPQEYLAPLSKLEGRLLSECCKLLRVDSEDLNVLNHGDLWPNNVMFGDDDLLFLDFQTAFYGCFAADMLYCLITCATEIVCDSLDELLRFYYRHLVESLHRLDYRKPIPSYEELLKQVQLRGVLILPPLSEAVALTMADLTESADMELASSDQPAGAILRNQVYSNPKFVALVDRLIPMLFEAGLFCNVTEWPQE